jgi:flavin-dependent dehydrogenase
LYNDDGSVKGVATGNMGIGKDGEPTDSFQLGMELHAKYTVFAEGARGHLGKQVIAKFKLDQGKDPQSYGIGIKELWEIDPARHKAGLALHSAGWPLDENTYGGSFLYHMEDNKVVVGFVVGLDYTNPWLSPFEEFQRFKTHPNIRWYFEGDEAKGIAPGKRISYGARAITAGGLLSLPKTVFPGGALVGCDAGYLNASRIKGSHAAIKTGMMAAEAAYDALQAGRSHDELSAYPEAFENSWLHTELNKARNFKQWFKQGNTVGMLKLLFHRETLEIRYKGKSISDVLNMTIDQGCEFFEMVPNIYRQIKTLQDVGLGYITLGQQATTLSGGEAQRVKLATELSKRDTGNTFYILDEPTTGLHFEDIRILLDVLYRLVNNGNTVLVIEHNMDIIKVADHIIDLGPEGGKGGGEILFTGTPEDLIKEKRSYTAPFLKKELKG